MSQAALCLLQPFWAYQRHAPQNHDAHNPWKQWQQRRCAGGTLQAFARYAYVTVTVTVTFGLDTEDCEKMDTEYRLGFSTRDITSPNDDSIIYNMCGMKAFFAQDGNINLMPSLLAEQGIYDKMRFDEYDG